ncbi:MAG: LCP family protein [Oscillospiraceae bacterium]|jgi:hypothetical protein|nr:LCP family protein [Oscillospiraceae bacterium]
MKDPNKTRQEYRTARQESIRRTLRTVMAFVVFIGLVAGIAVFYYWRHTGPKIPENTSASESTTPSPEAQKLGSAVFFVYLKSEQSDARAAALVRVDADTLAAEVRVLSQEQVDTLAKNGGVSSPAQCGNSLQSELGVKADRSVLVSERAFKEIVNTLGGLEVTMPEQMEFIWDGTKRTLLKGKNLLRGENLLRFLQWSTQQGDKKTQGDILCGLLALGLSERSHAKGEILFTSLINSVQSDISAMDYINAAAALDAIATQGITPKVVE